MRDRYETEFGTDMEEMFPEFGNVGNATFQVTDACNLACKYCYQINKGHKVMSFDVAKKFVDLLLTTKNNNYFNPSTYGGIILEFIGGEPFLQIDLIDQIIDYFMLKTMELNHPWKDRFRVSICSNGVLYFSDKVQKFMKKHERHLSLSITVDGFKEMHDACRVFPDGSPSYELAIAADKDLLKKNGYSGTKITVAPGNVEYIFQATKNMVETGHKVININCVYEDGWTLQHAKILYKQLKQVADYFLSFNDPGDYYYRFFDKDIYRPMSEDENDNYCWGAGTPILTNQGYKKIEDIKIGDLVYTHDGTLQPVIDIKQHFANNTVNLKCSGVFDLIATDNHKLFVKPFDYIGNKNKKHYKELQKVELKNIQHKDLIQLFNNPKIENKITYPKDLAYLVGRFIGDGYTTTQGGKSIVCSFNEENELKEYFNKANVEYSIYNGQTIKEFHIIKGSLKEDNIKLNGILSQCGIRAENKHLPPEVFSWDRESQQALLKGYIDADGYLHKNGQVRCNTVSYQLAQELMVLLRILGYNPTCYKNNRAGKSVIQGREVNIKDRYEISYYYEDASRSRYVYNDSDNNCWTYGLQTTPAEPQTVYNLTVANNHSYIAGGIVSSNCGGNGKMIACNPDGYIYPCLRYMESSLGCSQKPLVIGDVFNGVAVTDEQNKLINDMKAITRRSQSTDECFYCSVASGCSWCSAFNYQTYGTVNKRTIFHCLMHKATSLANTYYWNKRFILEKSKERLPVYCDFQTAIDIIGKDEYEMLLNLSNNIDWK